MSAEALVLTGPRALERRSFDLPDIGDNDALLRVEACGLCGTDHEEYTGHITAPHPFVPGHEVIGTIIEAGDAAQERWGVGPGAHVAVEVFQRCGECPACLAGTYRRCARHGIRTMVGFCPADGPKGLRGGYASHLYLGPDSMMIEVPESLDSVLATVFNPLGAGIRWAVELPETKPGDVVAVLGPGIRGLCASAAAKRAGAGFVMITGVGPRDSDRLALAERFGADLAVDVSHEDPARALKQATGGLADVVVDVTAKAPAAFAQAIALARPGGTVVLAGTRGTAETPGFNPDHLVYKEIRLLGALGVDVTAYRAAFDMLRSNAYPFAELPRTVAGFDALEPLIQTMAGEGAGTAPVHGVFVPDEARVMTGRPAFETFNEEWARRVTGAANRKGIDGFLGVVVTRIEPGVLVAEMPVTPELLTIMGTMHGGCLSALTDHVLGVVMYPVMPEGYWAATTEFKINLLAPVTTGVCTATAEIISMTRRLAVVRIEIENEGRLVAAAQGTCTIVAPKTTTPANTSSANTNSGG